MLGILCPVSPASAEPVSIVDGLGTTVRLEAPARRIIALYGGFNEILDAMGLGESIIARTSNEDYPPSVVGKPGIGTHMRPNMELIVGLGPDLVLQLAGRKSASETVLRLRQKGIAVAAFHPANIAELFETIRSVGVLTGREDASDVLVGRMQGRLDAVANRLKDATHRPSVFFEIRSPNLLAAGRGGIVNDIITQAGGINCVSSERKIVRLGEEALTGMDPEAYVIQKGPMNANPRPLAERPLYRTLSARQSGRVIEVDEKMFSRPGPRIVDAVERLARFLHPNVMNEDRNPE